MYALMNKGKIVQVAESVFTVHPSLEWVGCPDTCDTDWSFIDGVFLPPADPAPEQLLAEAKAARASAVAAIKVTTSGGKVFDGDEESQTRMSRAIAALNPLESTAWVLADNTIAQVSREEFQEALRLAGEAQTAIWVGVYQ